MAKDTRAWLYTLLTGNPAGAYLLAGLVSNLHWPWVVAFLCASIATLEIYGFSSELVSFSSGSGAMRLLFGPNTMNQTLVPVDVQDLKSWIPTELFAALGLDKRYTLGETEMRRRLNLRGHFEKLRIYVRTFSAPPFDSVWKSFMSFSGTSYVFLRDPVSAASHVYDRFKLYHELAHVSMYGITAFSHRHRRLLAAGFAVTVVFFARSLNLYQYAGLALFLIREVLHWVRDPIEFEAKADMLALSALDVAEVKTVVRLFERQVVPRNARQPSDYQSFLRLQMMKHYLAKRERDLPVAVPLLSWNATMRVLDPIFIALFLYLGYTTHPTSVTQLVLPPILSTVIVFLMHARVFHRVALQQQAMEDIVKRYATPQAPSFAA